MTACVKPQPKATMEQYPNPMQKSFSVASVLSPFFAQSALAALLSVLACPTDSLATEGGTGHYLPGGIATLIDLAPTKQGWVVEPIYLHYHGGTSGSKSIPIAGDLTFGLKATIDAALLGGFYTFGEKVLGANYTAGLFLPYVWASAEARISTPFGTQQRRDTASGVGDMTLIPAMLAWKTGFWQYNAILPIYAPTGDYQVGRLANPGLNYWTFDPTFGASYNNTDIGFNAALHVGISANTTNNDTDYTSGATFHLDGSLQQMIPAGSGYATVGTEVFYLQQVTADNSPRTRVGDFEGHTVGIGPTLGYVLPLGEETFVTEFRWLPELDTQRRLQGDFFWVKAVYQF